MQVKLRIIKGPNQGKEIRIPSPRCIIGRGEGCHIKAKSDAVSRQHCEIVSTDKEVLVRDLKSRNGTLVNDERTEGDTPLLSGDILRVGPLEFEVIVEVEAKVTAGAVSEIKDVLEKAAGAPVSNTTTVELNSKVDKWLNDADARAKGTPETRQFKFDETDSGLTGILSKIPFLNQGSKSQEEIKAEEEKKKKEEEEKQKLHEKFASGNREKTKNSREAAGDFLKRMFGSK
jgi:pSer/pThr/pTyr-binding forkhead associated (FHA) protein